MVWKSFLCKDIPLTCPIEQLQRCLVEISVPPQDSNADHFELTVEFVNITPPILALLVQVLNQPLPKVPTATDVKWDRVHMTCCTCSCSQEDLQIFASALATRTSCLLLEICPDILDSLFHAPYVAFHELVVSQWEWSPLACVGVGNLAQSCVSLKHLSIHAIYLEEQHLLGEALATAFHLESVFFGKMPMDNAEELQENLVSQSGDGIVKQLLCPPSRLKKLTLLNVFLEDHHFLRIVDILPTSQVQVLDVSMNKIGHEGILAFAQKLPIIHSLKEVNLAYNRWDSPFHEPEAYEGCVEALLQGMLENYSIEWLDLKRPEKRLEYCTRTNFVRARILASTNSITLGLLPRILEEVTRDKELRFPMYMANMVYFVFQNSPILYIRSSLYLKGETKQEQRRKSRSVLV